MRRALGVCYYPEHWPEERWAEDARLMAETGLTWVRIGEFAWSRLEPTPGDLRFDWLDRAIATLADAGLKIVLGTPTATPPRWMLSKHPDMLAVDAAGRPRKFGSRRHYCFSHDGYREECRRIAALLGDRYGSDPRIAAWQIDNEYGCHDTTLSYSAGAAAAFRDWLAQRHQSIDALNRAWGNVFWSMDYASFDEIDPPNLTVTEPNPAHVMAFRRFSSEQVVRFNRAQVEELRRRTDAPLIHNYMGRVLDFDHFAVGADLDIASWDSYPIGFLSDRLDASDAHKARYLRQGDPDCQAFHHDLYRAVGRGRWWVMEQQPGPVNWAPWNPAPAPGMVRLWSWEAFAHGAEVVSYFRWRQAPFGQEQMHAGLLRPDAAPAPGLTEAAQVAEEIAAMPEAGAARAPVAILFDYASAWAWETQPQGADFTYFHLVFDAYRALRRLGLSIDFIDAQADADLDAYRLVLAPGIATLPPALAARLARHPGVALVGPRTNARDAEMATPVPLPPALPGLDATVARVESLPPGATVPLAASEAVPQRRRSAQKAAPHLGRVRRDTRGELFSPPDHDASSQPEKPQSALPAGVAAVARSGRADETPPRRAKNLPLAAGGDAGAFHRWFEHLEGGADIALHTEDGRPAIVQAGGLRYLAGWPDADGWRRLLLDACAELGLPAEPLPEGLRVRHTPTHRFAFNYGPEPVRWEGETLPPAGVAWRRL